MSREFVMEVLNGINDREAKGEIYLPEYFTELNLCLQYSKDIFGAVEACINFHDTLDQQNRTKNGPYLFNPDIVVCRLIKMALTDGIISIRYQELITNEHVKRIVNDAYADVNRHRLFREVFPLVWLDNVEVLFNAERWDGCINCDETWKESVDILKWYSCVWLNDDKDASQKIILPYCLRWAEKYLSDGQSHSEDTLVKWIELNDKLKGQAEVLRVLLKRIYFATVFLNLFDSQNTTLKELQGNEPRFVLMKDFLELWIWKTAANIR